jgi:hypothetical protein
MLSVKIKFIKKLLKKRRHGFFNQYYLHPEGLEDPQGVDKKI